MTTPPHPDLALAVIWTVDALGFIFLAAVLLRRRAHNQRRRAALQARRNARRRTA